MKSTYEKFAAQRGEAFEAMKTDKERGTQMFVDALCENLGCESSSWMTKLAREMADKTEEERREYVEQQDAHERNPMTAVHREYAAEKLAACEVMTTDRRRGLNMLLKAAEKMTDAWDRLEPDRDRSVKGGLLKILDESPQTERVIELRKQIEEELSDDA